MLHRPWFAQPAHPSGTAILLPGRLGGVDTPLLHWSATALTQAGWSVLAVEWGDRGPDPAEAGAVRKGAAEALRAASAGPVLVVAKSLGTLALPWAVEHDLPGVWLTPLLTDERVRRSLGAARRPQLLVGGTADPYWHLPLTFSAQTSVHELAGADHGLQQPGDWRASLLAQVEVFDLVVDFAERVRQS